jgi:PAS domain S-box-containing protein
MEIINLDGSYERVNDAFCAMVGCTRQQLAGLSRDRITHPDDVGGDAAALRVLLARDAISHRREKRYLHASGQVIWAQVDVTLIHDSDGQPMRFIAQVQDISERRTYERRIAYMADHDALTGLLNRARPRARAPQPMGTRQSLRSYRRGADAQP